MKNKNENKPKFLFKILSLQHWQESQGKSHVQLSSADDNFIHFSTEDQLARIVEKYWSDLDKCVILKIRVDLLNGNLIFEANPGGTNKYYHLYNGTIPLKAVVEAKIINLK